MINGIEDHVHLLVKLKPTLRFSDFLRDLKSNSSSWGKENGIGKFGWQRRYGGFTVSESQIEIVRKYIRNQEIHHKKFDFKTEFETLLSSNGIPVDDFVWQGLNCRPQRGLGAFTRCLHAYAWSLTLGPANGPAIK